MMEDGQLERRLWLQEFQCEPLVVWIVKRGNTKNNGVVSFTEERVYDQVLRLLSLGSEGENHTDVLLPVHNPASPALSADREWLHLWYVFPPGDGPQPLKRNGASAKGVG